MQTFNNLHMKIVYEYFILELSLGSERYDLYENRVSVSEKTGKETEYQHNLGYGMSLDKCCITMSNELLKNEYETVDLEEYVAAFKEQSEKIMKFFKSLKVKV